MKVKFCCDSGANIHSRREEILDTEELGYTDEEWMALSDDQKYKEVGDWAWDRLEMYYEEL